MLDGKTKVFLFLCKNTPSRRFEIVNGFSIRLRISVCLWCVGHLRQCYDGLSTDRGIDVF